MSSALLFLKRIRPSSLPPDVRAEFFEKLSLARQKEGDYLSALKALRQPIRLYEKTRQRFLLSRALIKKGDILRQLEKFSEAYRVYDQGQKSAAVLSGKKVPGSFSLTLEAALGKAMAVRGEGKFFLAARWLEDLKKTFAAQKDIEAVAYTSWALGTTQRFLGQFLSAQKNLTDAIRLYKKIRSPEDTAYAQCGLGGTLRMIGEPVKSRALYKQAYSVFKKTGDLFGQAYSSCGQASSWRVQGKFPQARPFFKRAIRLYEGLGQKSPLGFVLWGQAQQFLIQKKTSKALKNISRARTLFQKAKDSRGEIYCDLAMGQACEEKDAYKSMRFYKSAYSKAKRLNLLFEMGHAKKGLHTVNPWPFYKALGAKPKALSRYAGLP